MSDMEFRVKTDIQSVLPAEIESNFEEVRDWLQTELAPYASLIVTEESMVHAKSLRADIRKLADKINAQKIAGKKLWMAPFAAHEDRCKTLIDLCRSAADNLDRQIKEIEETRREEKLEAIRAVFDAEAGEAAEFITWDFVVSPKWKNAGMSFNECIEDLHGKIETANADVQAIRSLGSPFETELLEEYSKTHDVRAVLAKDHALKERQRREEARAAQDAQVHGRVAENASPASTRPLGGTTQPAETDLVPAIPSETTLYTLCMQITGTQEDFRDLKLFFRERGMKFEKIIREEIA